jgi:cysteinyl-tRNA synthetase
MLSTHYRKPMDWTEKKRQEAERTLKEWKSLTSDLPDQFIENVTSNRPHARIVEALSDDLNTPLAISIMHSFAKGSKTNEIAARNLAVAMQFLNFDPKQRWVHAFGLSLEHIFDEYDFEAVQVRLQNERERAKQTNDYTEVDRIKAILINAGVEVRMAKDHVLIDRTENFDPSKLEALK